MKIVEKFGLSGFTGVEDAEYCEYQYDDTDDTPCGFNIPLLDDDGEGEG